MDLKLFYSTSLLLIVACSCKVQYNGYRVIKASAAQRQDLVFLESEQDFSTTNKMKILNSEPRGGLHQTTFYVHPDSVASIEEQMTERSILYETLSYDLQKDIDLESERSSAADWFTEYHTYDEIMVWLNNQTIACGPQCYTFDIGLSYEGRNLKLLKLTGAPNTCEEKPAIWIDAGIHAREWISETTAMFLIDRLIQEYATDPFVASMRDTYDWYFLTVVNPDGYEYTWTDDRLWRKSRQPVEGAVCIGADINRNFDFQWMTVGASDQPCSETFAGTAPFSEPEAKAIADYISNYLLGELDLFITLHTYGQLWMSPWGYTTNLPFNYAALERVGLAAVQTILDTSGMVYTFGSAANVLYESSGTSRDWAAGVPIIPFVYTIELRDENSFVLPPSQIIPTGEEIWAALKTTITYMQVEKPPTCVSEAKK